ncbi:putative membrane protein [Burkholderia phage Maja]|uniref:Putative membrane protein n=1 Tax=Burkholderia phage Maja TaxID=2767571 RepID=A0A7S6U1T1_9CAUD|nr:putative membrane protein [Burkholderia phage Maja]
MISSAGFESFSEKEVERKRAFWFVLNRALLAATKFAVYGFAALYMASPKVVFYPHMEKYSRYAHCWYIEDGTEKARCWFEKKYQQKIVDRRIVLFQETKNIGYLRGIYHEKELFDRPDCTTLRNCTRKTVSGRR